MSSGPSHGIASREDLLQMERALDCVHCGLCLPACPTYELLGRESASPRGRIYLMRGLAEGTIAPEADVVRDLDQCLVCRACEPVCPSGVQYGAMMEFTRSHVLEPVRKKTLKHRVKRWFLRSVLPHPPKLRRLASLLGMYHGSGLRNLLRRYGVVRFLSQDLDVRDQLLPPLPPQRERKPLPRTTPAKGSKRGRVAFLEGCVMPILLGSINRATVRVLSNQGFDVDVIEPRGCCGALSAHFGQIDLARSAALKLVRACADLGDVDAIVVNSAGCGAAMKEYGRLLDDQPGLSAMDKAAAHAFASKVKDVTEFLAEQGLRGTPRTIQGRAAYADACHLAHAQRVTAQPRDLLRAIPGLTLAALDRPDRCCGAGGLYNALQPAESLALLAERMTDVEHSGATILVSANPGCLLQWRAGVRMRGLTVDVVHPLELIDRAWGEP
jgi:glycolate oxidase iron-sulfur subunit